MLIPSSHTAVPTDIMTHDGYYTLWIESFNLVYDPADSFNHQGGALVGAMLI